MKNNRLAKNTILLAIGNILTKGLLFIMVPFFSSWLTTEDYGKFDLFCTYVSLLLPIISLATGEAVFRYSVDKLSSDEDRKKYISNGFSIVSINLFIALIVLFIARLVTGWELAFSFALLLIGEVFNNFLLAYLRALKKLNIYSFCSAFTVIIIAILSTIFISCFNLELKGLILGYAFGYILGDICIFVFTKFRKIFSYKYITKQNMLYLVKYSYPLIPNNVSWWIMNVSDRFLINVVLGAAANGVYAISNKIPAICAAIFSVFNISWQQAASEMVDEGNNKKINKYFNHVYNNMVRRLISLCIVILSFNFFLFNYVFALKYIDGYHYSFILISAIIFMLLSQFYGGIQISLKLPKENGKTTIIGAVVNIIVNALLIKKFGIYAAAISTLISYYVVMILRKYKLQKQIKFKLNKSNLIYIFMYLYFAISSLFIFNTIFNIVNLLIACLLFVYMNFDFFKIVIQKIKGCLL